MNEALINALPVAAFLAMTGSFRLLHDRTKYKKLFLICYVLAHLVLVAFLMYTGASMEELLLVLLAMLDLGLA